MELNFTSRNYLKCISRYFYLIIALGLSVSTSLSAQCSLACKSVINVSVSGTDCSILITSDIILNGETSSCPSAGAFIGTITYANGQSTSHVLDDPANPFVWADAMNYIHETVSLSITDPVSQNTCWGNLNIEDKLPPRIICDSPVIDEVSCCSDNLFVEPGSSPQVDMGGVGLCEVMTMTAPAGMPLTGSGCVIECSSFEWVVLNQVTIANNCNNGICEDYAKRIERTLIAVDEWGLRSDTLVQHINVKRLDIREPGRILCPPGSRSNTDPSPVVFTCETLPDETIFLEGVEVPAPSVNGGGLPSIVKENGMDMDTIPLFPLNSGDSLTLEIFQNCNVGVRYEDRLIPKIGKGNCGGYTLIRNWIINEWACPTEVADTCTQIFELRDTIGPILITGVNDFNGTTNGYTCEGNVFVPSPVYEDGCSGVERIEVTYPGGFIENFSPNGGFIELPVDTNEVIFVAYDECHNITAQPDTVIIVVQDNTPPVAICDEHTVVSLADYGKDDTGVNRFNAEVPAEVFDDGSYDDCGVKNVLVRKMDPDLCGLGQDTLFRPTAKFCCAEDFVMVILRVFDHNDNFNDCMFEVEIQNKIAPKIIQCPVDIMISCGINLDATEPSMSEVFGTLASEAELVKTYQFIGDNRADKNGDGLEEADEAGFLATAIGNQPDTLCDGTDADPFEIWDGQYWDNCGGASIDVSNDDKRNKCGIGNIVRTFSLRDAGGKLVETCSQVVQVKPVKPFDFNTIVMPPDLEIMSCGLPEDYGPDSTGTPVILEGQCDLVGFNYKDQVFLFNEYDEGSAESCFKIIRTWQFIDWCTFEGSNNQPFPMPAYEQIIKVSDNDAPTILFSCEERSECSYDPQCNTGYIELLKTAIDGCTGSDHLRWEAKVNIDIKGIVNVVDTVFSGVGNLANASGHYPVGKHSVNWTFWDRCGNVTNCDQIFQIKNCKAAAPYCIDGLVTDLMPVDNDGDGISDTGMIELWAKDFDLGSTHPCGFPVILSFSEDIDSTNRTFTCADARRTVEVRIYSSVIIGDGAHADTVQSFCITSLKVQDNNGVCDGIDDIGEGRASISGLITTELDQTLADAEVNLDGTEIPPSMTNVDGAYAFPDMPLGGDYLVAPKKDDDHVNGVTTLDLVMIQKHILGLKLLNSPFKKIAADVNKDQSISAADLVELRKLVLGTIDEYDVNDSWRFVDKAYTFTDENSPLNEIFAEDYEIPALSENMDVDFTAIKIGDVNNSVTLANYQSTEVRSNDRLTLIGNAEYKGNEIRIPIVSMSAEMISGLQFTLDLTGQSVDYVSIESGQLDIKSENLGLRNNSRGLVTLSWNTSEHIKVSDQEVLFTIVLRGSVTDIQNHLEINSRITAAEAYTVSDEIMDVTLEVSDGNISNVNYELRQNTPNPFKDETVISFTLPERMNATVSIHDITGKVVREYNNSYNSGLNNISISRGELELSGVLYYTLKTENFSATKRMVILD